MINLTNDEFEFLIFRKVHASRQDILHAENTNIENELVFSLEQLDTNDNNSMKHDQADKLDCLMYVLFEYISSQSGSEQAKSLFRDLLNVFNKILLPTHDSSHVQFLLFYICSFHTVSVFSMVDFHSNPCVSGIQ